MAEPILITIDVDDRGGAVLRQFSQTAQEAFTNVANGSEVSLKKVNSGLDELSASFTRAIGVSLTFRAVSEAFTFISNAASAAIKGVLDFDLALREVASISPEVRRNFQGVRDAIIGIDPALGTTTELTKGLYEVFSAGVTGIKSVGDAFVLLQAGAELGKAALVDVDVAVKVLATGLNAYGQTVDKAREFSDILFKTVELGQFRFGELAQAIGPVLPVAKNLGVSFADVNAALATLSQAGFSAANGATALRGIFIDLINNADKFRALGIDLRDTLSQQGLLGVFQQLELAVGGNSEALKLLIPDTRALSAALSLLGQDQEKVAANFEGINNAAGSTRTALEQIREAAKTQFAELESEIDRIVQKFSGPSLSALTTFLKQTNTVLKDEGSGISKFFTDFFAGIGAGVETLAGVSEAALATIPGVVGAASLSVGSLTEKLFGAGKAAEFFNTGGATLLDLTKFLYDSGIQDAKAFLELANGIRLTNLEITQLNPRLGSGKKLLDDFTFGQENLRKGLVNGSAALVQYGNNLGDTQRNANLGAVAHKLYFESLENIAKAAVATNGSLEDIGIVFENNASAATTFSGRLQSIIDPIVALGDKTKKLGEQDFRKLVEAFVAAERGADGTRDILISLGATQDFLKSNTSRLTTEFYLNADAQQVNAEELEALVATYRTFTTDQGKLGKQLQQSGVDVDALSTHVAALAVNQRLLGDSTFTVGQTFEILTGKKLPDFLTKSTEVGLALLDAAKSGEIAKSVLQGLVDPAIDAFRKFGIQVPEALQKAKEAIDNLKPSVDDLGRLLGGVSFQQARDKIVADIELVKAKFEAGLIPRAIISQEIDGLISKFAQLGGQADEESLRISSASKIEADSLLTVDDTLTKLGLNGGKSLDELSETIIRDFTVAKDSGLVSADALLAKFESTTNAIKDQFGGRLPKVFEDFRREVLVSATAFPTVEEAAKRLGVTLNRIADESVQKDVNAFNELVSQGGASFGQLANAAQALIDKAKRLGVELSGPAINYFEDFANRGKAAAEKVNQSLGDALHSIGLKLQSEIGEKATQTFDILNQAIAEGQTNFAQLAGAAKTAIDEIVTSGQKVPEEFQAIYRQLVDGAKAAGQEIGQNLTAGFDTAKTELEKLNKQLENFVSVQNFRSDLPGIVEQITRAQSELSHIPKDTPGTIGLEEFTRKNLQKELEQLDLKLRAAFDSALSQAKDLAKATGQISFPPGLESAAVDLGLDFEKIRKQVEDIAKTPDVAKSPVSGPTGGTGTGGGSNFSSPSIPSDTPKLPADLTTTVKIIDTAFTSISAGSKSFVRGITDSQDFLEARLREAAQAQKSLEINTLLAGNEALELQHKFLLLSSETGVTRNTVGAAGEALSNLAGRIGVLSHEGLLDLSGALDTVVGSLKVTASSTGQSSSSTVAALNLLGTSVGNTSHIIDGVSIDLLDLRLGLAQGTQQLLNILNNTRPLGSLNIGPPGHLLPTFANGTVYANAGQTVSLEAGEAVLSREEATRYRGEAPQFTGNVRYSTGSDPDYGSTGFPANRVSGFDFVPGRGYIPSYALAAATGRLEDQLGPTGQRDLQRTVTATIQTSIARRDINRQLQRATVTRKGQPTVGAS